MSIYNIFNFIIAGGGGKSNAGKGSANRKGGGTVGGNSKYAAKAGSSVPVLSEAEKREMQKEMLEELFRRYYPYSDFFRWK